MQREFNVADGVRQIESDVTADAPRDQSARKAEEAAALWRDTVLAALLTLPVFPPERAGMLLIFLNPMVNLSMRWR